MDVEKARREVDRLLKAKKAMYEVIKNHHCQSYIQKTMAEYDMQIDKWKGALLDEGINYDRNHR